jgi:hypothetical protein
MLTRRELMHTRCQFENEERLEAGGWSAAVRQYAQ